MINKTFGQEQITPDKVPLLIQVEKNPEPLKIEIPCKCVMDSLEVIVIIGVHFDNEMCDTTKTLTPIKIYIGGVVYHRGTPDHVYLPRGAKITDPFNRCIWETCSDKFLKWMKMQPYSQFYRRGNQPKGGKALSFSYKVMLVPDI